MISQPEPKRHKSVTPQVFRAISRITAAFAKSGIAKSHINVKDQYQYRSIDDVLGRQSLNCRKLRTLIAKKHGIPKV